jgi:hypothetical protein
VATRCDLDQSPDARGGAPPGPKEEGAPSTANAGRPNMKDVDRRTLPEAETRGKQFYDNARGNIERALREAIQAWSDGKLSDADYEQLDAELRQQQGSLYRPPAGPRLLGGRKSKLALGWPRRRPRRMPDREASRARARTLAGSAHMPPRIRVPYTECERAVLFIVAREVKHHGLCDLAVGRIAAEAGVCVRTVQNAVAEAVRQGHLAREERERPGRPNDTNVLRIMSCEWLAWIKIGPLGCKVCNATKNIEIKKESDPHQNTAWLESSGSADRSPPAKRPQAAFRERVG